MSKIIPQDYLDDKTVSENIRNFFAKFRVCNALKVANAYKQKGFSVSEVFQYLFILIFSNRSMHMDMLTGKNKPRFNKDTVYRFINSPHVNWLRFTTVLASSIIRDAIANLTGDDRVNVFIFDDTTRDRNRSKKVELLAKVYDHAEQKHFKGFRMLTLGWSDGNTFIPVNNALLSTENEKNRINEARQTDKRTAGHRRREMAVRKATSVMLDLLHEAKKAGIRASYVLFDSWFTSPQSIHDIRNSGHHVVAMVKKRPKCSSAMKGSICL